MPPDTHIIRPWNSRLPAARHSNWAGYSIYAASQQEKRLEIYAWYGDMKALDIGYSASQSVSIQNLKITVSDYIPFIYLCAVTSERILGDELYYCAHVLIVLLEHFSSI